MSLDKYKHSKIQVDFERNPRGSTVEVLDEHPEAHPIPQSHTRRLEAQVTALGVSIAALEARLAALETELAAFRSKPTEPAPAASSEPELAPGHVDLVAAMGPPRPPKWPDTWPWPLPPELSAEAVRQYREAEATTR